MSLVSEGVEVRSPLVAGVGEPSLATVGDYIALMKPRVMSLVVFTALVGLAVAPGSLHPVAAFTALLCIAVGAGAAGALNMWYDADVDALMTRTARRPVPMGRVRPGEALAFGLTLGSFAVVTLGLLVSWVASALLAFTIFFWTPPHFWALALYRTEDYARARIPMLPVVSGDASTRRQIMVYTLILVPLGVAPWAFGYTGALYGVTAIVTGAIMVVLGWQVFRESRPAERASRNLFAFSILYLFLLFAVLLVERGWGGLIARLAA